MLHSVVALLIRRECEQADVHGLKKKILSRENSKARRLLMAFLSLVAIQKTLNREHLNEFGNGLFSFFLD